MADWTVEQRVLVAPEALTLESAPAFRRAAAQLLAELPAGRGRLIVDLAGTRRADSAGLAALIHVRRLARAERQTVRLRGASGDVRSALTLAKLDRRFELEE